MCVWDRATQGYAFELGDAAARRILSKLPHSLLPEFVTAFRVRTGAFAALHVNLNNVSGAPLVQSRAESAGRSCRAHHRCT